MHSQGWTAPKQTKAGGACKGRKACSTTNKRTTWWGRGSAKPDKIKSMKEKMTSWCSSNMVNNLVQSLVCLVCIRTILKRYYFSHYYYSFKQQEREIFAKQQEQSKKSTAQNLFKIFWEWRINIYNFKSFLCHFTKNVELRQRLCKSTN